MSLNMNLNMAETVQNVLGAGEIVLIDVAEQDVPIDDIAGAVRNSPNEIGELAPWQTCWGLQRYLYTNVLSYISKTVIITIDAIGK